MFIKSLVLNNFQCYSGENELTFNKGLNIIIGDNGAGKSKIYDAFYWLRYDKVFDSIRREFTATKTVGHALIADRAKNECAIDESVEACVQMTVETTKQGTPVEYKIIRSFKAKKIGENEWKGDFKSELYIEEFDIINFKPVKDTDYDRILDRLMPENVKPYMWFQGEQVDSLIDFKKSETLIEAINILSNIKEFDIYKAIAATALKAAEDDYQGTQKRFSSDKNKSEEQECLKKQAEEKISRAQKDLENAQAELARVDEAMNTLIDKHEDATKINNLKDKIDSCAKEIKKLEGDLEKKKLDFQVRLFSEKWLLMGFDNVADDFEKRMKHYNDKKQAEKVEKQAAKLANEKIDAFKKASFLPKNIPTTPYLTEMLEKQRCYLCGREAKEGSEAWQTIQSKLQEDQKVEELVQDEVKHYDFSKNYTELASHAGFMKRDILNVDSGINRYRKDIKELKEVIDTKKLKLGELQQEQERLISRSGIQEGESYNIKTEYRNNTADKTKYTSQENNYKRIIERETNAKIATEEKLKGLVTHKNTPEILEKETRKNLMQHFKNIVDNTRERVFLSLIERLEAESNKHFSRMTAENRAISGKIVLVKTGKTYMPKNVDDNGYDISSPNDSNIILIKLAVIMAIISAKKSSDSANLYTFISDSPVSKFSDNYIIGFCRTTAEVYGQSIITSKELLNEGLRTRIINELGDKLGSLTLIEPNIAEEERANRNTLNISIKKLK